MRGIVIPAGGMRWLANAYVTLSRLRRLTSLPVEIAHRGPAEAPSALRERWQEEFPGLVFRDLVAEFGPGAGRGWQLKPLALAGTRFSQALLLDADNLPLRSPELLPWAESAVLWPDVRAVPRTSPALDAMFGLDPNPGRELESGQLLVDVARCRAALDEAARLSLDPLREEVYARAYGDADVFRLAWRRSGCPFLLVPHEPAVFGGLFFIFNLPGSTVKLDHPRGRFYGTGLLQHHPDGEPFFVHRTVMEWDPYLDCRAMTHVAGTPAEWLVQLQSEGQRDLERFRRRYRRFFPMDWGRWAHVPLRALALWLLGPGD